MKAAEVVLKAKKASEIQRLVSSMTGYRKRPRKQLPKKSNFKPPFGRFVSGSNDPSTKPVSEDYVFWLKNKFNGMTEREIKQSQQDYKDDRFLKNPVIYRSKYE